MTMKPSAAAVRAPANLVVVIALSRPMKGAKNRTNRGRTHGSRLAGTVKAENITVGAVRGEEPPLPLVRI